MTAATPTDEQRVRTLLDIAGIHPAEHEIQFMIDLYPSYVQAAERLHAMPEARYEAPELVFDPLSTYRDWAAPDPADGLPAQRSNAAGA